MVYFSSCNTVVDVSLVETRRFHLQSTNMTSMEEHLTFCWTDLNIPAPKFPLKMKNWRSHTRALVDHYGKDFSFCLFHSN